MVGVSAVNYEAYRAAVWRAVGQWLDTGRDTGKLHGIAQGHGVLSGDVEDMLTDCLVLDMRINTVWQADSPLCQAKMFVKCYFLCVLF